MNVRDCLMHMTGLGWGVEGPLTMDKFMPAMVKIRGGADGTLADMVSRLAEFPLEFSPGTQWLYGLSTDICGRLVELMSGQSLDDYLDEHIFGPLGMTDTGFHIADAAQHHRLAALYQALPGDPRKLVRETDDFRVKPGFRSGGGGLVSTAGDYLKFAQALLDDHLKGGHRLLSRKTVELMTANHLPGGADLPALSRSLFSEATYSGVGFGLGFATTIDPADSLGARA